MDDPEQVVNQLEDEAEGFLAFTGAREPSPNDRFILVMGMTGSGKSTFVARATGRRVRIGHDLFSCTQSISIFDFVDEQSRRVYLIDTPGFDDTSRSDAETLDRLGSYLSASYGAGIRIDGVIFLQRITDVRMAGSGVRNLAMLRAMCDLPSYARFAIVTTMWPESEHHRRDRGLLAAREDALYREERYFGSLISRGAFMTRHAETASGDVDDEARSARRIISRLLGRAEAQPPMVLRIQRELADERKTLDETLAGQEHAQQIQELQAQISAEERERGKQQAAVKELRQEQLELISRLAQADAQIQTLHASMSEMHHREQRAVDERIERLDRSFREKLQAKNEELAELEESVRLLRVDSEHRKAAWEEEQQEMIFEEERAKLKRRAEDERARRKRAERRKDEIERDMILYQEQQANPVIILSSPGPPPPPYSKTDHVRENWIREQQRRDHEAMLADLRQEARKAARQSAEAKKWARRMEQEQEDNAAMVEELRREKEQYERSYDTFKSKSGNIRNGAANGLAAGVTSGVIAAGAAALCLVM
ncbi:hypothetical protein F5Y01DRAFT_327531 [Xylaria sp. FL0043]|nr:hypothetical protein F5Y01DRAFT_327531 [Xylaria sp. FL0043]